MNAPLVAQRALTKPSDTDELLIAPSLERRRLQCYLALMASDTLAILAGFAVAGYLYAASTGLAYSVMYGPLVLPIFLTLALYNGAYSIVALREEWTGIARALSAIAIAVGVLLLVQFLIMNEAELSRVMFGGGVVLAAILMVWLRLRLRQLVRWWCGQNVINELVIDDGGPHIHLPGAIHVSAAALDLRPDLYDPHALDRIGLALRNIDRVVVSCPGDRRMDWSMMLKGANVDGEVLDDQVVRLGAHGARTVAGHGLLLVSAGPLGLRDRAIKRVFDLVLAGAAVFALLPLFIVVTMAIKLDDGGPIFFRQRRMGRGNCFFNMYKFRSMTVGLCDADGNVSASRDDRRVTRVGRFIRATSLDELPQLFNVLLGDMSLVGPRPHATGSLAGDKLFWEVDPRYWQRHGLKPGLSGLAQVRGYRGATDRELDLVNRLQSDLEYLEGWTIGRDIKILLLTLRVLVHDRAY
jgi:lipopolysaccharide/colanic/teichoic acid biosynthesis glycosyltransferase